MFIVACVRVKFSVHQLSAQKNDNCSTILSIKHEHLHLCALLILSLCQYTYFLCSPSLLRKTEFDIMTPPTTGDPATS